VEALGNAAESEAGFRALADESDYYGFLAADRLDLPYRICPVPMPDDPELVKQIKAKPGIQRALELRLVDLPDFARSEWLNVQRNLDRDGLRGAAAIAMEAGWVDRSVFSMIASGDRQFYDQRFPVIYNNEINQQAQQQQLDSAWLFGIMRSESALDENVISTANAHGLMQITPATARQLTRRHNLAYRTPSQLLDGRYNIRMGTHYLRDLLDSYDDSQVVTLSAYNAGPNAAERWLQDRPAMPADIWIELIPYFETREYVPRVLAFTAIYDWRLGNPLRRISSRMPDIGGKLAAVSSTSQVCAAGG
jgi:soluble lytic murein transglycosylase